VYTANSAGVKEISANAPDQIHCQSFLHKYTRTEAFGRHPTAPFLVADLFFPNDRKMQILHVDIITNKNELD